MPAKFPSTRLNEILKSRPARFRTPLMPAKRFRKSEAICVGTPPKENGEADLSAIDNVARQIANESAHGETCHRKGACSRADLERVAPSMHIARGRRVTFRVGLQSRVFARRHGRRRFSSPRSRRRGRSKTERSTTQMREIYRPFWNTSSFARFHTNGCPATADAPLLVTTIDRAELIKHASNSFLALKISYANVLADLCEKIGADVNEVTHAMGLNAVFESRIGLRRVQNSISLVFHLAGLWCGLRHSRGRRARQRAASSKKYHRALWVIKRQTSRFWVSHSKQIPTTRDFAGARCRTATGC